MKYAKNIVTTWAGTVDWNLHFHLLKEFHWNCRVDQKATWQSHIKNCQCKYKVLCILVYIYIQYICIYIYIYTVFAIAVYLGSTYMLIYTWSTNWHNEFLFFKMCGTNITSNHIAFYCSIHFRRYHQFFFVYILDVEPTIVQPHHSRLSSDLRRDWCYSQSGGGERKKSMCIYIYIIPFFWLPPSSLNERTLNPKKKR